ncbi:MAG: endolytic transglycosylase MltG [Epulopiscium sp.]|nr:endolytic transglycosylase MltG [Candidatus Epulonipiscium sp.]
MNKKQSLFLLKAMTKVGIWIGTLVLIYIIGKWAFTFAYQAVRQPAPKDRIAKEVTVEIPKGATTKEIATLLQENGLIHNALWFQIESRLNNYDGTFRYGKFILNTTMDQEQMMKILQAGGEQEKGIKLVIPEGFAIQDIAKRVEQEGLVKTDEFLEAVADADNYGYDFIHQIPDRNQRLEGYLFPATYEIREKATAKEIVSKMLNKFEQVYSSEYQQRAAALGYSMDEIITIASIIEKEARLDEERPKIAGVIYNRLEKDMKLQMCSTVIFVLGKPKARLLYKDLEVESPYNTYLYEDLPPGPIANPGEASIRAALYPEEHEYLYFVVQDEETGQHYFSTSGEEHEQAKKKYNQKF